MNKKNLLLLLILLIANFCFAQEALKFTKKNNGKQKTIIQGREITVKTNNDKVYRGKFIIKNDSLVITKQKLNIGTSDSYIPPQKNSVHIKDIEFISTNNLWTKILGAILLITNVIFTTLLVILILQLIQTVFILFVIWFIPSTISSFFYFLLGINLLVRGKKHKRKKWKFTIENIIIEPNKD